jgi:type III restriction enzyme
MRTGKVQDKLKIDIKDNKLNVPEDYEHVKADITALSQKSM